MNRDICDRRAFVKGMAGAFAFAPFAGAWAAEEKPYARIGVITDTHVKETVESCDRVRMAMELFRAHGVGMVVNAGDIADRFCPAGYRAYRSVVDGVFPDAATRPEELYVYAWHDAYAYKDFGRDTDKCWQQAFAEVRGFLRSNEPYAEGVHCGIPYLVFPQFLDIDRYRETIDRTAKAHPGKPILVFDHIPPGETVYNSWNWGDVRRTKVLRDYPQAIAVCGHVHGSLYADNFIWQREFTVVNAGCLDTWGGLLSCSTPTRKPAFGALILEFYPDRMIARRYDVRDGSEIHPEAPWHVSLPYTARTAAYRREALVARTPVPQFAADARLEVSVEGPGFSGLRLRFPEAAGPDRAFLYRFVASRRTAKGGWEPFARREAFGDFHVLPKLRTGRAEELFPPCYFDPDRDYLLSVYPLNAFGGSGRPLTATVRIPPASAESAGQTLFSCADPMKELSFADRTDACVRADADGEFYRPLRKGGRFNRLVLPKGLFAGPSGTRFRVTVEAHLRQPAEGNLWSLKLVKPKSDLGATARMATPGGDSGRLMYVIDDFVKADDVRHDGDTYQVVFEWGDETCSLRLHSVRVERMCCA